MPNVKWDLLPPSEEDLDSQGIVRSNYEKLIKTRIKVTEYMNFIVLINEFFD